MSNPLVSILIPTYNGERFLRAALRSAQEQSYRNVEILVGDDGSTDRTPEIVAAAAAQDERIRVIGHAANVGAYDNLRLLLEAARGEYVKYLLHDDVLGSDCVRELVRGIEATPGAALAFSRRTFIDEHGRALPTENPTLRDRPGAIDGWELGTQILEACVNVIGEFSTTLFRRDAVDLARLWEPDGRRIDSLTDVLVWLDLLAQGPAFYTPRTLSRFRLHPAQNSQNQWTTARAERDWIRLIDHGIRSGFLPERAQRRRAYATVLQRASMRVVTLLDGPDTGPSLETLFLATTALVELRGETAPQPEPLWMRAHRPEAVARFTQGLEVWGRDHPVALAAPRVDQAEISATVAALRDVVEARVAEKLVVAVPAAALATSVPLVERALADGPDIDVELVPCDEPADLLVHPWLAVAPRGARWHLDKAAAVWAVDVPPPA